MSLIPLDESRASEPSDSRDSPDAASLTDRFRSGLKAVLLALPGVSTLAGDGGSDRSEPGTDTAERDGSPDRTAPVALPGGSTGEFEVVSTETDDTLTVEAVDNPDATISSDTWEPVER